ncbi:hypothetical protein NC652_019600 [Populus alba x Populus x berolinensis]|uniref:Uncharacterized protein n=1 Tax=Populus alba x Populus x berolinensis TaxID=444605 RepID=A0AAD6VXN2_9ROSI|nr:hypothetical protein NC652_019600 [Populus alba x Populus x berolinensis]KAJ6991219.1 hypothetical protein NC653_019430 [Populus alba x Populus x berolinensis]
MLLMMLIIGKELNVTLLMLECQNKTWWRHSFDLLKCVSRMVMLAVLCVLTIVLMAYLLVLIRSF